MKNIVALYDMVEFYAFQNVREDIKSPYKKGIIGDKMKEEIKEMIKQMRMVDT